MRTNVIYGSDAGGTKVVATRIASAVKGRAVDIRKATLSDFEECDLLILGSPTYGLGELQCDWEDHADLIDAARLDGKAVALFGTGDQFTYPDTFVDAIGILYDRVAAKGARMVGATAVDGYDFVASAGVRDGRFVGLALDEDNQSELTQGRIAAWIKQLA